MKRFGAFPALDSVDFTIEPGTVTALLGPNGAGKTTVMDILAGLARPTSGTVRVLGADPRHGRREWRSRIGVVAQSNGIDLQLTVAEALRLFARHYPRPLPVAEVLDLIDLTDDAHTRIGALSGGQRRRADLAVGVIGRPELLFLDEPTTGLDPEARRGLWQVVTRLVDQGTTVLLTTHYLDEAQHLAGRLIVLVGGRIVADAAPEQLRTRDLAPTIRLPLPPGVSLDGLPVSLAAHRDPESGELRVTSADLTTDLEALLGWSRHNRIDLTGLQVGSPSLEDAYLALVAEPTGSPS
ncbi:ABC transporter ATP-binding protein [Rugosimonospora africana]|uniref:ABC transporter ATP-binding protein n=1 Tax=Rugosimonospora africana TaxID=556532 RepID=UPI00194534A7|nr:ABC transporter ATP-binding protein [Rugosimonospora africana]